MDVTCRSIKFIGRVRRIGPYAIVKNLLKLIFRIPIEFFFDLYFIARGEPATSWAREALRAKRRLMWKNMNKLLLDQGRRISSLEHDASLLKEERFVPVEELGVPEQIKELLCAHFSESWAPRKSFRNSMINR